MCEYVISHHACSQHELLGLVVTRQLKVGKVREEKLVISRISLLMHLFSPDRNPIRHSQYNLYN